ncbi:MAG: GNAT family N-acetyltransferase [Alphaproteobacteria bacterium]|nr:GNAT family N-acetyltransferase [Alphaproteobacteria bacterium]
MNAIIAHPPFHASEFIGNDGLRYLLTPFCGTGDYHKNGVRTLMAQQAIAHGLRFSDEMINPLSEAFGRGRCHGILCIRKPTDNALGGKVVALMTYTQDLSPAGQILHLEDIVVEEKERHQGIGSKCFSGFLLYAKNNGMAGIKLHTKHDNAVALNLFNKFGNAVFDALPPVMEIPKPQHLVSMPQRVIALNPNHINDAHKILSNDLKWNDLRLLADVAYGHIDNVKGLVCVGNTGISGVAILCPGYSTISCTTNIHINTIASLNIEQDIPSLIEAFRFALQETGRQGSAMIDFRDGDKSLWAQLIELSKRAHAIELTRSNVHMISASWGGKCFAKAAEIAKKEMTPRRPKKLLVEAVAEMPSGAVVVCPA